MFRTARFDAGDPRRSHRQRLRARPRSRSTLFARLQLEELESRAMLSATSLASLSAHPQGQAVPLESSGGHTYYTPDEIRQAYGINQTVLPNGQLDTGYGETIAIIVAGDDPNIEHDLAAFDQAFGLPAPPWYYKAVLPGATPASTAWAQETALDVEWAHAIAPEANILLVEAASDSYSDLLAGANWAASVPTVVAVSMSWAGPEFAGESAFDPYLTTPPNHIGGWGYGGVTFVASSGDNGAWYGAQYPATSPNVLSVGGTSLYLGGSGYGSESAWAGSGGGFSSHEPEPSFQWGAQSSGWRTSPDVAFDGDPNTGVLVYNSYQLPAGASGWWISGGTSAGAPQWAGIIALADEARNAIGLGSLGNAQAAIYGLPAQDFHDIYQGSNGYLAGFGYDLVTGRGSPLVNRVVWDLLFAPTSATVNLMWTPFGGGGSAGSAVMASAGTEPILDAPGLPAVSGSTPAGGVFSGLLGPQQIDQLAEQTRAEPAASSASQGSSSLALSDALWQHLDSTGWSDLEQLLLASSTDSRHKPAADRPSQSAASSDGSLLTGPGTEPAEVEQENV